MLSAQQPKQNSASHRRLLCNYCFFTTYDFILGSEQSDGEVELSIVAWRDLSLRHRLRVSEQFATVIHHSGLLVRSAVQSEERN